MLKPQIGNIDILRFLRPKIGIIQLVFTKILLKKSCSVRVELMHILVCVRLSISKFQ